MFSCLSEEEKNTLLSLLETVRADWKERYQDGPRRHGGGICQTLHFMLKEDISHEDAVRFVAEEVAHYKKSLERNRTQYKIVEETTQPDGSIMIKIKKQYNQSPVGDYLNE